MVESPGLRGLEFGSFSPGMLEREAGNQPGLPDHARTMSWPTLRVGSEGQASGDLTSQETCRLAVRPRPKPSKRRRSLSHTATHVRNSPSSPAKLGIRRRASGGPLTIPLACWSAGLPAWHPAGASRLSMVPCHPGPLGPRITAGLPLAICCIVLPTSMSLEPAVCPVCDAKRSSASRCPQRHMLPSRQLKLSVPRDARTESRPPFQL